MTIAERIISEALAVVGYHGDTPEFQSLLGPPGHWPLGKAYGKGGMSTCAMVAIGILRRAGVPLAQAPYRVSAGLADIIRAAQAVEPYGAWVTPAPGLRPEPGDVVEQLPLDPRGSTHVLTVVGWEGDVLVSVDGGQVHPADGLQCIAVRRRRWLDRGRAAELGGKPVRGWLAGRLVGDD